jgi:hypothetical protein
MRRLGATLRVVIALITAMVLVVPGSPAAAQQVDRYRVDITVRDGVTLRGTLVQTPTGGRRPALVLVSPWGTPDTIYLAQSDALARRGYVVLSYTTRGFGASGGTVSLAGPQDVDDVSDVLDWLTTRPNVDPRRIGLGGVSYGAGISLLAAAFEPRVKAVVAFSGWTDLTETFYRGGTRTFGVIGSVRFFVEATGRPSPELLGIFTDFFANRDTDRIADWTRTRSAATYLDEVNANHPAVYLAQAYGDSFFPPTQIVDFFTGLTGPKRLELSPGDHGTPEASGFVGAPNPLWEGAARWLDQYVAGRSTGIDREDPVVLRARPAEPVETYPDWDAVATASERYALGPVRQHDGTGPLTRGPPPGGWAHTIRTGYGTTADAGYVVITNWFESLTGIPPIVWLPTVSRNHAGVWLSAPLDRLTPVRGGADLRLRIRGQPAGTVIAYLYDVDTVDIARLLAHQPATWRSDERVLHLRFPAIRHDIPAGHRLGLIVDTVDPLYGDQGPVDGQLEITGHSWIDLPVR